MIKLSAFSDEAASDIYGQIAAMKRNKIEYTELRSIDGKNVSDFTIEEATAYKKIFDENGIKVWSIGSPIGKVEIDCDFEEYKTKVEHVIDLAVLFGAYKIRAFSFFNAYEQEDKVVEYLNEIAEMASEKGVKMCHENEKAIFGDTVDRVLTLKKRLKGWEFIYDPANYLQCDEKSEYSLEKVYDGTYYFHVKDVIVKTGELVPAGQGDGNIKEIVERVKDDKVFTLEPHLKIFEAYKTIDGEEMKNKFNFATNDEAFDTAVKAFKEIILSCGYHEVEGGFEKC